MIAKQPQSRLLGLAVGALPETNSSHLKMDAWNTILSFLGWLVFRGELLVSGGVNVMIACRLFFLAGGCLFLLLRGIVGCWLLVGRFSRKTTAINGIDGFITPISKVISPQMPTDFRPFMGMKYITQFLSNTKKTHVCQLVGECWSGFLLKGTSKFRGLQRKKKQSCRPWNLGVLP